VPSCVDLGIDTLALLVTCRAVCRIEILGGHMLQSLTREVHADLMLHWTGAIGLAIGVGIAYFSAAQLSLKLLA
jgi:hypothetical protein